MRIKRRRHQQLRIHAHTNLLNHLRKKKKETFDKDERKKKKKKRLKTFDIHGRRQVKKKVFSYTLFTLNIRIS